jgi:hypothetical protein
LPRSGVVLISVRERDKPGAVGLGAKLVEKGFEIAGHRWHRAERSPMPGVPCKRANKVREGRPHIVDMIKNDEFAMIVNTTEGKTAIRESNSIRREAVHKRITYYTTLAGALATCEALDHLDAVEVNRLQDCIKRRGHETDSDDAAGRRSAAQRTQAAEGRGSAARHQGDCRGAQPRRSLRECRIPRRARAAGFHRRPIGEIEAKLSTAEVIDTASLNNTARSYSAPPSISKTRTTASASPTRSLAKTKPTSRPAVSPSPRRSHAPSSARMSAMWSTWVAPGGKHSYEVMEVRYV